MRPVPVNRYIPREERRVRVAEMLRLGYTQSQIARSLGVGRSTVVGDCVAIREEWARRRAESYEQVKDRLLAELAELKRVLWGEVAGGDLKAMDRYLRVIDFTCKILGAYAPKQYEVLVQDQLDAEIDRLAKELNECGVPDDEIQVLGAEPLE